MINLTDTRENELEILSAMLKDKETRLEVINKLKVNYFITDLHKRLFKTMNQMEKQNENIDLTLVIQKMDSLGIKKDGDIFRVSEIYNNFSHRETLNQHIEKLIEGYRSNEFKRKMYNFISSNELLDTDGVINQLSRIIKDKQVEATTTATLQEWLLDEVSDRLEFEKPKALGLITGYRELDKTLKGIVPGSIVTLLARSGVGKTTFGLELTKKIASKGESVTYFSLEMPPKQMYLKMVLSAANMKIDDYIGITKRSTEEVEKISIASNKMSALNIDFQQERNIDKITNLINYYVRKKKTKVFFIDYLNIVHSDIKTSNTDILYNEITAELKQVALKTGSIIFLITQANRAVDSQQDKRPNLKDIKSSSSIEQNSDYIISLYRNLEFNNPYKRRELENQGKIDYSARNADINPNCVEIIVLKNRHTGECNTVCLNYSRQRGFTDWVK